MTDSDLQIASLANGSLQTRLLVPPLATCRPDSAFWTLAEISLPMLGKFPVVLYLDYTVCKFP
jgi:hypothetical protein